MSVQLHGPHISINLNNSDNQCRPCVLVAHLNSATATLLVFYHIHAASGLLSSTCALLCLGSWSLLSLIHFSDLDEVGKLDKIDDKIELKCVSWFFCTKVSGVHHNQLLTPYIFWSCPMPETKLEAFRVVENNPTPWRRLWLHQLRAAHCSFIALREAAVLDCWRVAAAGKTFLQDKCRLTIVQDHGKQTYKDHHWSKSCARFFAGPSCTSSKKSTM